MRHKEKSPATSGTKPAAADFWKQVPLHRMNREQWESLCDGCGKCCLFKVEDEQTARIHYTNVACRLLDPQTCRCTSYAARSMRVPDCVTLTMTTLPESRWLPATCAYRLLAEGRDLPSWHPLVSGDPNSVLQAGHSVAGRVVPENQADDLEQHLIDWVS